MNKKQVKALSDLLESEDIRIEIFANSKSNSIEDVKELKRVLDIYAESGDFLDVEEFYS